MDQLVEKQLSPLPKGVRPVKRDSGRTRDSSVEDGDSQTEGKPDRAGWWSERAQSALRSGGLVGAGASEGHSE